METRRKFGKTFTEFLRVPVGFYSILGNTVHLKKERKVPRAYSPAEESAGSLNGRSG
jgi:hypothetical protein